MFSDLTKSYYRGAKICAYVFSTTDRQSFDAIPRWIEKVREICDGSNLVEILIQNKCDLIHQAVMTP